MPSILIAGGGLAGLTCAWRLARRGHDVEVLELEDQAGGRARERVDGALLAPQAGRFITRGSRNLLAVAVAVGLGDAIRSESRGPLAVLREGLLRRFEVDARNTLFGSPLLTPAERLRLARLGCGLWRHGRQLQPLWPESANPLEVSGVDAKLWRAAGDSVIQYAIGPLLRFTLGCELEDLSPAQGLLALRFLSEGSERLSFDGGLSRLTTALAAGARVRTGCRVISVETQSDGALVRFRAGDRDRRAVADAAVVAVPGDRVAKICPKLTPAERGFFESVRYAPGVVVALAGSGPREDIPFESVAFPAREGLDLAGVDFVDRATSGLVATLRDEAALRNQNTSDAALAELVAESLSHTPIGPVRFDRFKVRREPSMRPRFEAGALRRLHALAGRSDRSPRLAFAGDYLLGPTAEAAVTSGMRAAAEVERALA